MIHRFLTLAWVPLLLLAPSLSSGEDLKDLFVNLTKKINPTVVSISTSINPRRMAPPTNQFGQRDPFWDFFEQFMGPQGPPGKSRPHSMGTGFIISQEGHIVTNNHVIKSADEIHVKLNDDETDYIAKVVGQDPRTDIALIKISRKKSFPVVRLGHSKDVQVGEWVAAFGNPYGHSFSVSKGIISAKGRTLRDLSPIPFLQTDASINPGNSGGPLVNTNGEVIGVNAAIDARAQGIGFAIPIDEVKRIINDLKSNGKVVRGFIGVTLNDIGPQEMEYFKLTNSDGALILSVMTGSPAAKAGIQPYDVVTKFGDKKVKSAADLVDAVKDSALGTSAAVSVLRKGKSKRLKIKITEPPNSEVAHSPKKKGPPAKGSKAPHDLGFKVSPFSRKLAKQLGIDKNAPRGPIVTEVAPGSVAQMASLRAGDIILDVNRRKVRKAKDVLRRLKPGSNVLRVYHGGRISLIFLKSK